jgi:16S rRNA (uracil1498-N3)-methyltransferase
MTAPLFLVEQIPDDASDSVRVLISGAEGRHAVSVKRLTVGEPVLASDGFGRVAHGVVVEVIGRDQLVMSVDSVVAHEMSSPRITVVQALAKGDRADLAIELMTEVGVDVIVPWSASRSIAQWKADKAERGVDKWQATAREATKQSRRAFIPQITGIESTAAVASRIRATRESSGVVFVLHESADVSLNMQLLDTREQGASDVVLIVGPEGGISDEELGAFVEAGARPARLGPDVLRTSTAGGAAIAVVSALTGRW